MSHGSNHPRRFDRPRFAVRLLRKNLVEQVGCVNEECREMARETVADGAMGYTEAERLVRIPRSLRGKP